MTLSTDTLGALPLLLGLVAFVVVTFAGVGRWDGLGIMLVVMLFAGIVATMLVIDGNREPTANCDGSGHEEL